jgi:GAF domain-containing protein
LRIAPSLQQDASIRVIPNRPAPTPDDLTSDSGQRAFGGYGTGVEEVGGLSVPDTGSEKKLLEALKSFASSMTRSFDLVEMCHQLSERSVEILGADGAGVSVADGEGLLRYVTATDGAAAHVERAQEKAQLGPCRSAFDTQELVVVGDVTEREEWPDYREAAEAVGYRSVLGVPLTGPVTSIGALNVYSSEARAWDDNELEWARILADMATAYLIRISELQEAKDLANQLQVALDSRVLIEQAKGMVANDLSTDVHESFERLRRHARSNQLKLADLARDIVERKMRPDQL